uniref:Prostaglandin F2-alpha receptor n=2 Tax=Latimeria chalumnae TaxID=7897 RepID=H3AZT1_LATCH
NGTCCTEQWISVIFPIIFMTIGILSNSLAVAILMKAYKRFKMKSKASFLFFATGLVSTDLFGHIINGTIAVFVYAVNKDWTWIDKNNILCSIFGICMIFFGLCPLFLGSVMAVERCIGVCRPIFHYQKMTLRHVKVILIILWLSAIVIALLPILSFRPYEIQASKTWCFFRTKNIKDWVDRLFLLLFSCLGLTALCISLICNVITGIMLIQSKRKSQRHRQGRSHHYEMIIQLVAIMCVSWICWTPFLITMARVGLNGYIPQDKIPHDVQLLVVRMATWNQILDPWVYILLRKAILKKLFQITGCCCGMQVNNLHPWELISIKYSLKAATIAETPVSVVEKKLNVPTIPNK